MRGLAMRYGVRKSGSRTMTRTGSGGSGSGVTNQYDAKVIYRRRRVPGRKLRRIKRAKRSFIRKYTTLLGCNQFVKTNTQDISSGANTQVVTSFMFCGAGIVDPHQDLASIKTNIQTSGTAVNWRKNETLYIKRAVCDVTLFNSSATATADIDVYLIKVRKNIANATSIDGFFTTQLTSEQKPDGSAATGITTSTIGTTPFQAPQFCSYLSILKKTKYLISAGQSVHFQFKQGFRSINGEATLDGAFFRGFMGVLIIWNGVYQTSILGFPSATLGVTYQRTYNVKYMAEGDDRLGTI